MRVATENLLGQMTLQIKLWRLEQENKLLAGTLPSAHAAMS